MDNGPLEDGMTPEDQRHWETVQRWKEKRLNSTSRQLVPTSWREKATKAGAKAREQIGTAAEKIPNAEKVGEAFKQALEGLTDAGSRAGAASVRHEAVLKAYRKRGHDVDDLAAVRALEADDIHKVKPRLDLAYIAASAAQGAGTGFLVSGGTMIAAGGTVGTGGVAAAPGIGAVVGAIATDAAATIVASNRAVGHVAAYYGHDVDDPAERLFALGVLSMGLAQDASKALAYRELNSVVQALARRQAWSQLNRNQVARAVSAVYRSLGMTITKRKLSQAVPVVGVAIGAGLNARALARVVDDAEHLYLERHLREKYGIPLDAPATDGGLVEIIDAEIVGAESDGDGGTDRVAEPES